jgi:hypothetical protein
MITCGWWSAPQILAFYTWGYLTYMVKNNIYKNGSYTCSIYWTRGCRSRLRVPQKNIWCQPNWDPKGQDVVAVDKAIWMVPDSRGWVQGLSSYGLLKFGTQNAQKVTQSHIRCNPAHYLLTVTSRSLTCPCQAQTKQLTWIHYATFRIYSLLLLNPPQKGLIILSFLVKSGKQTSICQLFWKRQ